MKWSRSHQLSLSAPQTLRLVQTCCVQQSRHPTTTAFFSPVRHDPRGASFSSTVLPYPAIQVSGRSRKAKAVLGVQGKAVGSSAESPASTGLSMEQVIQTGTLPSTVSSASPVPHSTTAEAASATSTSISSSSPAAHSTSMAGYLPGARPALAGQIRSHYSDVCASTSGWMDSNQLPLVYHPKYNIGFMGLEKLHPFDSAKFKKVLGALIKEKLVASEAQTVLPTEASMELLGDVHTQEYLKQVHTNNLKIVQVTELVPLLLLPTSLLRHAVISPMKHHVGGTVLAAGLALERGWAINMGGGMHHAHASDGMGWCPFDDIMLAIRRLRKASGGQINRVLVIDLDAHQGNGVARDKLLFRDNDTFILDMYNANVFPQDEKAKQGIDFAVELKPGCTTDVYLSKLRAALIAAEEMFPSPDLVVYNAGTDILEGDPLGRMSVSREGITERDELVWQFAAHTARAPIVMTLSGGYAKNNASVIADSIANLLRKFVLAAEPVAQ